MKKSILLCILLLLFPGITAGESLYEKQLNRGIRNSDPYASILIEQSKTESSKSTELLRDAAMYSPDLPTVYFELARDSFSLQPDRVFESIDYLLQGISSYKKNFWWSFMLLSSLFTSLLLSFLLAIGIMIVIRLLKDIPLLSHEIQENRNKVFMFLILIPAFFGPLYLLCSLLILLGLYMKRWDKSILYFYIVFLLISPWTFYALSIALLAPTSGPLKAAVEVNEARGNTYALSVLENSDNPVELFSYALASKREGKYKEAIASYNKLLSLKPDWPVYNNLANCYVALHDMETAKELYNKSSQIRPSAATLYNLSQVHRETLDFNKGEEFFLEAQKLDRDAVSRFRTIFGRKPNRFVIDEPLPESVLWHQARKKTHSISTMGLSLLPPFAMPALTVLMGILFYAMNTRMKNRAYRCTRCGKIMCNKCEKHILWGHMCPQCFKSLVKLDELDARERIARILNVYEYKKKQRDTIKLLSLILPGSGFIYAGNILRGMLFLWPFLFFLFIPAMNALFVIGMPNFSHLWLNILSLFFMGVVYVLANIITRRRVAKGWL